MQKTLNSITANVIHSLDADLVHITINNSKHKEICTVHDCYITSIGNVFELKEEVVNAVITIFANKNTLDILHENATLALREMGVNPDEGIEIRNGRKP